MAFTILSPWRKVLLVVLASSLLLSCSEDDGTNKEDVLLSGAIENYANIVYANYSDALSGAKGLQMAVQTFVNSPSEANLANAKKAWLAAREYYGQTEAFRFYGGPIDDEDGPEGRLNSWPLDESYIDYVSSASNGDDGTNNDGTNIINSPEKFPSITKEVIASLNEKGSETNISSGYHSIEFLLWGQDLSDGPGGGQRPYTDYMTDGTGTNDNQERRGQYLLAVTELLVNDLQSLVDAWKEGATYRVKFTSSQELKNSFEKILGSLGKLSKGELAGERMFVAYDLRSKEDEHSCFSDNTHRDIVNNALGIQNVYMGRYKEINGTSIMDVVATKNSTLANEIKDLMAASVGAAGQIQAPFDQEFLNEPGRARIKTTIDLLKKQGDKIAEAAAEFGFALHPEDV